MPRTTPYRSRFRRVTITAVLVTVLAPASAHAAPALSGASVLRVQQHVAYRATGLVPRGTYSLRIRRRVNHGGRSYRCMAYLSAPRPASGTERFLGSVGTGLQCRPARGGGRLWQPHTFKGRYRAVVCVVAASGYLCDPHYTVATKRVRIR